MHKLANVGDVPSDGGLRVKVDDKCIALFKVAKKIYAIDARCIHAEAFLDRGFLDGHDVVCPLHGWAFDVRDGSSSNGISTKSYPLKIIKGVIYLADKK